MITQDAAPVKTTVTVVLGMHRSGTSLLANMLGAVGYGLGKQLLGADEHNAKGYFEDAQVVDLNDSILAALDRSWGTLEGSFPLPAHWDKGEVATAFKTKISELIGAETARAKADGCSWALKDPRISRLYPLWREAARDVDVELMPVLALRSPMAVAASLEKRDGTPSQLGHLLWLVYNAELLVTAGADVRYVCHYDDWFSDPDVMLAGLLAALGQNEVDENARKVALSSVVDAKLCHHATEAIETPPHLLALQKMLIKWRGDAAFPSGLERLAVDILAALQTCEPWREALAKVGYFDTVLETAKQHAEESARLNHEAYVQMTEERDLFKVRAAEIEKAYEVSRCQAADFQSAYVQMTEERDLFKARAAEMEKAFADSRG